MKIMQKLIMSVVVFGIMGSAYAANYSLIQDTGTSAKTIGLANIEGFSEVASSIFENPASLYRSKKGSISFFTTSVMGEMNFNNVAISTRLPIGTVAFGYYEAVNLNQMSTALDVNNEVNPVSYFDYKQSLMKIAYQYSMNSKWHFGAALTRYQSHFDTFLASGMDGEVGLNYVDGPYSISAQLKNILASKIVSNEGTSETLPRQILLGGSYKVVDEVNVLGQVKSTQGKMLYSMATDYAPQYAPQFHLRMGYKQALTTSSEAPIKGSLSLGVGLEANGVHFDYAFEKSEYIANDNKHYMSFDVDF